MLEKLNEFFEEEKLLNHAAHVVQFDMETVCPPKGMELAGETQAYLSNKIFKIHRDPNFLVAAGWLYDHRDELDVYDRALAEQLHREDMKIRNRCGAFITETSTRYAVVPIMVTTYGMKTNSYIPQPIDTSDVTLPAALEQ